MSLIKEKSFEFAICIVELTDKLQSDEHALLVDELFMSGTKIGLNVHHAQHAENKDAFVQYFTEALYATARTQYWLKLMLECECISQDEFKPIFGETIAMNKIMRSIIATCKEKQHLN